jgi:xylulokinase
MHLNEYIASFDIGTTGCKGTLVGRDGRLDYEAEVPVETLFGKGDPAARDQRTVEQHPEQWLEAVASIARSWWAAGVRPEQVKIIAMSGQMQDVIPVGADGLPVRPAILYSDARAAEQAERIACELGEATIREVTGNHMDGSIPLAKLLWMKEREPELMAASDRILFSSKDYVIRRLTGRNVTDPTSAATAGLMELSGWTWRSDWLERLGLDPAKLPDLLATDDIAGEVHAEAAALTGFAAGTPVLCGIGDAGASTLGAGVAERGDMYVYLGTTGWVAASVERPGHHADGLFHLAHAERGLLIAIAPLMNAGNAHKWAVSVFGGGAEGQDAYAAFEREAASFDRAAGEVLFLPYLNGERCPVQDASASGSFVGLRTTTTRAEMGCAVLEGVALAMRQVMEILSGGRLPERLTLIGGGSRSDTWCRIFADVCGAEVSVPGDAQYLPALGCASAGFVRLGWADSYADFTRRVLHTRPSVTYVPDEANAAAYERKYAKYVKLYPALAELF